MFLYHNNIDLALIQETRKNKSLFLRKYKAISKKSYGKGRRKGGLSIIFKPFLNLFITEKLIDHEDFMAEKQKMKIKKKAIKSPTQTEIVLIDLSDHKLVINEIKIKKDFEIKEVFSCSDEIKFQEEFISFFEKKKINTNNFPEFRKKFKKKIQIIQKTNKENYLMTQKMVKFMSDPNTKKIITQEKNKNWEKILEKINSEFKLNNINWWKHYNQIRGNNLKMIKNNTKMEKRIPRTYQLN
ncbi:hypothetical protein M0812_25184 [Anaeramoeba flamelloides]|uniref:Uncharacterized protein n=1 Tax=Anaeramoeba flamelloides TaxID=1746091 RepID=A0AAV7YKC5_9EUKA|nr:hypothetical protein M0812_25184 [Anaeramoeba flamelloides]